jgi:hypothetical protein
MLRERRRGSEPSASRSRTVELEFGGEPIVAVREIKAVCVVHNETSTATTLRIDEKRWLPGSRYCANDIGLIIMQGKPSVADSSQTMNDRFAPQAVIP